MLLVEDLFTFRLVSKRRKTYNAVGMSLIFHLQAGEHGHSPCFDTYRNLNLIEVLDFNPILQRCFPDLFECLLFNKSAISRTKYVFHFLFKGELRFH